MKDDGIGLCRKIAIVAIKVLGKDIGMSNQVKEEYQKVKSLERGDGNNEKKRIVYVDI